MLGLVSSCIGIQKVRDFLLLREGGSMWRVLFSVSPKCQQFSSRQQKSDCAAVSQSTNQGARPSNLEQESLLVVSVSKGPSQNWPATEAALYAELKQSQSSHPGASWAPPTLLAWSHPCDKGWKPLHNIVSYQCTSCPLWHYETLGSFYILSRSAQLFPTLLWVSFSIKLFVMKMIRKPLSTTFAMKVVYCYNLYTCCLIVLYPLKCHYFPIQHQDILK